MNIIILNKARSKVNENCLFSSIIKFVIFVRCYLFKNTGFSSLHNDFEISIAASFVTI